MSLIIEKRIWDYIDGNCTGREESEVAGLIQTDPEYKSLYRELTSLNESLKGVELDGPSMSFTRDIMEKVSVEPVPGSLKSLIDKRIIYGIAGFFLVTIFALVFVALSQVEWTGMFQTKPENSLSSKILSFDFSSSTGNVLLKAFYFADAILGLYLLDAWLRRPEKNKKIIHNS